jgi:hypothetical protein
VSRNVILFFIVLSILAGTFYVFLRVNSFPHDGVVVKGPESSASTQYISLATSVVSLLTAVVGLIKLSLERKEKKRNK